MYTDVDVFFLVVLLPGSMDYPTGERSLLLRDRKMHTNDSVLRRRYRHRSTSKTKARRHRSSDHGRKTCHRFPNSATPRPCLIAMRTCKKKRIEIKMEVGWNIVIGVFGILAVIGKCGELYYNSRRVSLPPPDDNPGDKRINVFKRENERFG